MTSGLIVVMIRGGVNIQYRAKTTLKQLHLLRSHRATIVPNTPTYRGMLSAVKDFTSWCSVTPELVAELLEKRGRMQGGRPITQQNVADMGFKGFNDLAKALAEGKVELSKLKGVKPSFALAPPRGGFKKSIRRPYTQGGVLSENPDLPKVVRSML